MSTDRQQHTNWTVHSDDSLKGRVTVGPDQICAGPEKN